MKNLIIKSVVLASILIVEFTLSMFVSQAAQIEPQASTFTARAYTIQNVGSTFNPEYIAIWRYGGGYAPHYKGSGGDSATCSYPVNHPCISTWTWTNRYRYRDALLLPTLRWMLGGPIGVSVPNNYSATFPN